MQELPTFLDRTKPRPSPAPAPVLPFGPFEGLSTWDKVRDAFGRKTRLLSTYDVARTLGQYSLPWPAMPFKAAPVERKPALLSPRELAQLIGFKYDPEHITANRESWFRSLADALSPWFESMGHPLYNYRVSVGWTSAGLSYNVMGECWHREVTEDGAATIHISPFIEDKVEAAGVLFHELAHAVLPSGTGHKGDFVKLMKGAGLASPWTSAGAPGNITPEFRVFLIKFLRQIGEYPHRTLLGGLNGPSKPKGKRGPGRPKTPEGPRPEGQPRKQGTYLRKAWCPDTDTDSGIGCGYTVRITQKWLNVATPTCPNPDCDRHGKDLHHD